MFPTYTHTLNTLIFLPYPVTNVNTQVTRAEQFTNIQITKSQININRCNTITVKIKFWE